jgi:hypothetical protein
MAEVTLHGRIYKKVLQFEYAGHYWGARRTSTGWWVFLDYEYIGTAKDYPLQYAYDYLTDHPERKAS